MLKWFLKLIVGSRNQRVIKQIAPIVDRINEIEKQLQNEPEQVLRDKTALWKEHLDRYNLNIEGYSERVLLNRDGEENRTTLIGWADRFDLIAEEFKKAADFIKPAEVSSLNNDEMAAKILEAQILFAELKEEFPAVRASV